MGSVTGPGLNAGAGSGATLVDMFVDDVDLSGGDFTEVPFYGGGMPVPRMYVGGLGLTLVAMNGSDVGKIYTLTPSGPCVEGAALTVGQSVTSRYSGLTATAVASFGSSTITFMTVNQSERVSLEKTGVEIDRKYAMAEVLDETIAYLSVGNDAGSGSHADSAFECDTELQFPTALDMRVFGRILKCSVGAYAELITRNVDALFGAVDSYELALNLDEALNLNIFSEHIRTGQTSGQNPKAATSLGEAAYLPVFGVPFGIRHTIDYTGGSGGNGVEKLYVLSANGDVETDDGRKWKAIYTLNHSHPESMRLDYTEPFYIGLSEHKTRIYEVQMFNGIDADQLVDLHAADAVGATEVVCRLGTTWTAGPNAEVVNF